MSDFQLLTGDLVNMSPSLPYDYFQAIVTSPPYFRLRRYMEPSDPCSVLEIGQEDDPDDYAQKLVNYFRVLHPHLRDDGTLWVVIGDRYSKSGRSPDHPFTDSSAMQRGRRGQLLEVSSIDGFQPKTLLGCPWRFAIRMIDAGWILRSEIIWHKPNAFPESAPDRPVRDHETIFMFSKQPSHFCNYPALLRPAKTTEFKRLRTVWSLNTEPSKTPHFAGYPVSVPLQCLRLACPALGCCPMCGAPLREDVVRERVPTRPGTNARTDPNGLARRDPERHVTNIILTGKPERTCSCSFTIDQVVRPTVLDPFCGSATTGIAAHELNCHFVGIDLNPRFITDARARMLTAGATERDDLVGLSYRNRIHCDVVAESSADDLLPLEH